MNDAATTRAPGDRADILAAVGAIAERLSERVPADEANNTLTAETVAVLEDAGMFRLKLPRDLGGRESDPATQLLAFEALSYANPAAGWCAMVGSTAVGLPGAFLPDDAIAEMFPKGRVPRGAIAAMPIGRAEVVDGGYVLTGRWPFGSGVRHSEWISAAAIVMREDVPERRMMVFPTANAALHDNWQVAGLAGTGSCDFSVEMLFVPDPFTWNLAEDPPKRGGPLYSIPVPGFVANEHAGFALGVGRRALESFTERETAKKRGFTDRLSSLAARPAVQKMIGASELRLRAAKALALEVNEAVWETVSDGGQPSVRQQGELRAVATLCTDVALDAATDAFRYSGGGAIFTKNILQQCLRDMNAAAQHLIVSEIAYENLGQMILGVPDVNPMQ